MGEENAMEVANIEQQQGNKGRDDDNDEVVSKTSNDDGTDKIRRIQKDYERSLNEARFGLRPEEAKKSPNAIPRKRRSDHTDDFGDLEVDAESKATSGGNNNNRLATTMNTIEQRSETASRKRRPAPVPEQLDDVNEFDHELAQGIKMMEEELGKIDDDEDDDNIGSGKGKGGDTDMTDPD